MSSYASTPAVVPGAIVPPAVDVAVVVEAADAVVAAIFSRLLSQTRQIVGFDSADVYSATNQMTGKMNNNWDLVNSG